MSKSLTCLYCSGPVKNAVVCPSCDLEVTRSRLKEGIARLSRLTREASQLGLFNEAREFDQMLAQDTQELYELERIAI